MDIRKLQRAIVDGLEDVKGQNIVVFNTEHLSALFERVVIASGTSNRQTKALAASVRDAVKSKGFGPTRTEGEENGEWIIVDCGAAVVHLMQPGIREYYHLEEIWGDKPVKLKLETVVTRLVKASEPEPDVKAKRPVAKKVPASKAAPMKTAAKKVPAKRSPAKAAPVKLSPGKTLRVKPSATKAAVARKAPARSAAPVKKAVTRTVGTKSGATKPTPPKVAVGRGTPPAKAAGMASKAVRRKA
jgi:ribosome-associated protein